MRVRRDMVFRAAALCALLPGCDPGPSPPDRSPPARSAHREPPLPALTVPRLAEGASITIDGKLDEPAWKQAAHSPAFVNVTSGRPDAHAPVQGRVKLLYDATFFYLGFTVSDTTLTGGFAVDAGDPHLWTRDTVEVMIDPDGDGDNEDYYEIQINPQNLVFDSRFDSYNLPHGGPNGPFGHEDWSAHLESAVQLEGTLDDDGDRDKGYLVEAKIPWSSLSKAKRVPPQPGDRWRMNFYAMQDNGGVAWSPILRRGNFHFAPRFGRITWGSKTAP